MNSSRRTDPPFGPDSRGLWAHRRFLAGSPGTTKPGLFLKGQRNGVWVLTLNVDDKVFGYDAYYNGNIIGEQVTTSFTLGQAIFATASGKVWANRC